MKVVAAGTINRDTLIYPDGTRVDSFGGLLYSLVALAHLLPDGWSLYPVSNVGRDVYDEVLFRLSRYPNVALEGLCKVEEFNNHVYLEIDTEDGTREVLKGGVPPIFLGQVEDELEDAGMLLLNFTSGFDLPFQTLRALSESYQGAIMMDYHSLALGRDRRGYRFPRRLPNWLDWVRQVDILQLNEREAALLAGRPLKDDRELKNFARPILAGRTRVVVVTQGARGARLLQRRGRGVRCTHVPGHSVPEPMDTTGCGDLFGAAFAVKILLGGRPLDAAAWGVRVAAEKCKVRGMDKLDLVLADLEGKAS